MKHIAPGTRSFFYDPCFQDIIKERVLFLKVSITPCHDRILVVGRFVAIAGIEFSGCLEPGNDLCNGRISLDPLGADRVELDVFSQVDEELGRPAVGPVAGKGDRSRAVVDHHRLVLQRPAIPESIEPGIVTDPELDDVPRLHAKDGVVGIETGPDQHIKPVGCQRGPLPVNINGEIALRGLELRSELFRCRLVHHRLIGHLLGART